MALDIGTYVVRQMEGVRSLLGGLLEGVTREEWLAAPAPGQNPIGFTAWHVPSIQDWAIHTWMQNGEPLRARPEWREKGMMTSFLPIGIGLAGAQEIAGATTPVDVLAYADAVLDAATTFVTGLPAEAFETVPASRLHLSDERYQAAEYLDEVSDMYEQPYWRLFAGACTGHCRGHLGEMELGLAILRGR